MATIEGLESAAPFYKHLLQTLQVHGVPFLVGGAFGFAHFTGIRRPTKDLDIFIRQRHWAQLERLAQRQGYRAELAFAHWLGKVHNHNGFVDVIFNSGNGLSPVDDAWFEHACDARLFDLPVRVAPPEESLWTKAFIMERERYDGADVAHLLHACAPRLDWQRLLSRFGPHWRVLLSHLVLFGFIYPGERALIPRWLMDELIERLGAETHGPPPRSAECAGTLLSREQYLPDVAQRGYDDPRLAPPSTMSPADVAEWTTAIPGSSVAPPPARKPAGTKRARPRGGGNP
ncbi:MAG: hypothetical protein KIT60_30960 [Burkholderiaceae bacterium]|nr:hypothetical protein [Burkholderiaceae bacterium]